MPGLAGTDGAAPNFHAVAIYVEFLLVQADKDNHWACRRNFGTPNVLILLEVRREWPDLVATRHANGAGQRDENEQAQYGALGNRKEVAGIHRR